MAALSVRTLPEGLPGRVLALVVTALGLGVILLGAVQPLVDAYQTRAEALRQRVALAGRMQDVSALLPALRRQEASAAKAGPPVHATLAGASDAIATATLQSTLETMANGVGGHVTSAEALQAEQQGDYRRVSLRVSVDADWPTLVKLLQAIERASPRMFVDDLQLHAQPTSEKQRELPLDISFVVLAFRAPGVTAAASSAAAPVGDAGASDAAGTTPTDDASPDAAPAPQP